MDYLDIGLSNIRFPNEDEPNTYTYKYDSRINIFPEETYLHEFLHTLERVSREYGHECILLHDYEKKGYKVETLVGLRKWYNDFMTSNIADKSPAITSSIYSCKPVHEDSFEYSMELELDDNPDNIIEEIQLIFKVFINRVNKATNTIIMKEGNIVESSRF